MEIEIHNTDPSGCFGYKVYVAKGKLIENHTRNFNKLFWDEEDILRLLGPKKYKAFTEGKCCFRITRKEVFEASQNNNYYK